MPLMENKTAQYAHKVICASPIEMKDLPLADLADHHSHMRCLDLYNNRPERDGKVLIGILIGLLIGIPLAFVALILYRRGCFGLIRPSGPGEYSRAFYKRAGNQDDFYI